MTHERDSLTPRDRAAAAAERTEEQRKEEPRRDRPAAAAAVAHAASAVKEEVRAALFPETEVSALRTRWEAIQTGFVDEPKAAVSEADALVGQVVARLAEVFGRERTTLEQQWDRGDQVSTEDLRIALRRYRSFFDRLLSV
jgi:hypothetical protein